MSGAFWRKEEEEEEDGVGWSRRRGWDGMWEKHSGIVR